MTLWVCAILLCIILNFGEVNVDLRKLVRQPRSLPDFMLWAGAPYEGHPYESIVERLNPNGIVHMVPGTHMGAREKGPRCGYYTDDTMTTLALGLSIVENQQLLAQHAADNYYKFWKTNPVYRGLPDSAQKVLNDVHDGMSITITGRQSFPDGSFANGGAMRISPIGLV